MQRHSQPRRWNPLAAATTLLLIAASSAQAQTADASPPQHLRDTGLFTAGSNGQIDPRNISFSPQYPLWSDGTRKRRWIQLPPGASIDASQADAWEFPPGTRLWKEFGFERPIETRFIERLADGSWRFATYLWNEQGTDATLAPREGTSVAHSAAPNGRYDVPAEADCRACHEGAAVPVLGFSALQLSSDRDPLAPHADAQNAANLQTLAARGLIVNLPGALLTTPPRISARSPVERAALGYLHGNCAHCHNHDGAPVPVDLTLSQHALASTASAGRALASMLEAGSRFRLHGGDEHAPLIAPGEPQRSVLLARIRSRNPQTQMPPLGTQLPDTQAVALLERWINERPRANTGVQR